MTASAYPSHDTLRHRLSRQLVIKRILDESAKDAGSVECFLMKPAAAQLIHPNVVQIFDLGSEDGAYDIAMEYVRGFDLSTVLAWARRTKTRRPSKVTITVASMRIRAAIVSRPRGAWRPSALSKDLSAGIATKIKHTQAVVQPTKEAKTTKGDSTRLMVEAFVRF